MADLRTNPERDLDLDLTALGVVSNTSEAVGVRERLVARDFADDHIFIFEDEDGADLLRPADMPEGDECHAEGHLRSGHRIIAVSVDDENALEQALDALKDLGVREPDVGTAWVSRRDAEFNQEVFNTGGVVAERSAASDAERESINSREGAAHQADANPWPPSPLAPSPEERRAQRQEEDRSLVERVFATDDPRGLVDRIRDTQPDGTADADEGAPGPSDVDPDLAEGTAPEEDAWDDDRPTPAA